MTTLHRVLDHNLSLGWLAFVLALSMATSLISSCTTIPKCTGDSPAADAARKPITGIDNKVAKLIDTRIEFHHAALNPESYATEYPLFLLGIEKPKDNFESPYKNAKPTFDVTNLKKLNDGARKEINEEMSDNVHYMTLTHVLRTKRTDLKQKKCFIYNVYKDKNSASWCTNNEVIAIEKDKGEWTHDGWNACFGQITQRDK